jgi:hypothetical protein
VVVHKDPRTCISSGPIRYPDFQEFHFHSLR